MACLVQLQTSFISLNIKIIQLPKTTNEIKIFLLSRLYPWCIHYNGNLQCRTDKLSKAVKTCHSHSHEEAERWAARNSS